MVQTSTVWTMETILRSLSAPLGYLLASYLKPSLGDSGYLVGSSLASALTEMVISAFSSLQCPHWLAGWRRYAPWYRWKTMIISDASKAEQMTSWLRECYPEVIQTLCEGDNGQLRVYEVVPGTQITVPRTEGRPYVLRIQVEQTDSGFRYRLQYRPDQVESGEILHQIVGYIPHQTVLRTYRAGLRSGKGWGKEFEEWTVSHDLCRENRDNTFYTEQVQRNLVEDSDAFIRAFLLGKAETSCKRTYFLHGKPGSGKTSLTRSLFGRYKIFNLPGELLLDAAQCQAAADGIRRLVTLGEVHVVVIDELDKVRGMKCDNGVGNLCSFLDGVTPNSGRITLITANDRKLFDKHPVLERPGRVDRTIEMLLPDDRQLRATLAYRRPEWALPETPLRATVPISTVVQQLDRQAGMDSILQPLQVAAAEEPKEEEDEATSQSVRSTTLMSDVTLHHLLQRALDACDRTWVQYRHLLLLESEDPGVKLGHLSCYTLTSCDGCMDGSAVSTCCLNCALTPLRRHLQTLQTHPETYPLCRALVQTRLAEMQ